MSYIQNEILLLELFYKYLDVGCDKEKAEELAIQEFENRGI